MNNSEIKAAYDEHGFVVLPGFLNSVELAELESELDRYIREVVPGLPSSDAFYQDRARPETLKQLHRMGCDAYFRQLVDNPKWKSMGEMLVGEAVTGDHPEWFNKPPATNHVTPPHQDNFYFCQAPPHVVTIWLALDRIDVENGCLRYVDGSHKWGFRPHGRSRILGFSQGINDYSAEDFTREVPVPLSPGDAVAHHGMTIHRADANMSRQRHRRALAIVYTGDSCRRDEDAYSRYMASSRAQQQELGVNLNPPS